MMFSKLYKYRCIFCDTLSRRKLDLCYPCEQELPFLRNCCTRCASPLPDGVSCCGSCLRDFPAAVRTTVLFSYEPPIDQLIMSLKFQNNLVNAKIIGELLANHLIIQYQKEVKPQVIIPMPLHYQRLRERGYNQALELSRPIAKKLILPIDAFSVIRPKNTLPQAQLSIRERHQNIKHAFCTTRFFQYSHVAVVDDVITTGNTILELCRALVLAGAKKIDVWCCAKSLFKNPQLMPAQLLKGDREFKIGNNLNTF